MTRQQKKNTTSDYAKRMNSSDAFVLIRAVGTKVHLEMLKQKDIGVLVALLASNEQFYNEIKVSVDNMIKAKDEQ